MKKLIAVVFSMLLVLGCFQTAYAVPDAPDTQEGYVVPYEQASEEVLEFSLEQLKLIPANPEFHFHSDIHS